MNRILACCVAVLLLSGCGTKFIPTAALYEKPEFVAPAVPAVTLTPLNWKVESPEKFCLAPDDFKSLLSNDKAMRDSITKLNSVVDAYKEYYKPHEKTSP